jgi:parallel beta-helix repeat protein
MRLARLCVIASVLALAVVAVPPAAHATTGNLYITQDTTLTENHFGFVSISASNVTLDCANHTIQGPPGTARGITMNYVRGVTVKNCVITGSFGWGIYTVADGNNRFLNNWISVNGTACRFNGSTQNLFQGNVLQGNAYGGCIVVASNSNTFAYNRVNYNTTFGLYLESSNNNLVVQNEAGANTHDGIYVRNSHNNTLNANTTTHNSRNGIRIEANNNLVTNNYACANTGLDANWVSGTGNRFGGNTFCRKSPNIP